MSTSIHITQVGTGKPLVLFHGWGFDSRIWHPLLPMLAADYHLYLVDLPGFGHSASMEWALFQTHLLAQLPATFAVLGWSMGGLYATRLAVAAPERVTHVLNIASSPYFMQDSDWPGVSQQVFANFYTNLVASPAQILNDFMQLQLRETSISPSSSLLERAAVTPTKTSLLGGLDVLVKWDLRDQLIHLQQPVGYVFGRLDAITPYKLMQTMQKNYPTFHYHGFSRAAHAPFLSHQQQFIAVLKEFINV